MSKLVDLQTKAREIAAAQGHELRSWRRDNSGSHAPCRKCGAEVYCYIHPPRGHNKIEGDAVSRKCNGHPPEEAA